VSAFSHKNVYISAEKMALVFFDSFRVPHAVACISHAMAWPIIGQFKIALNECPAACIEP
jgi:hypothetical protein